MGRIGSSRGGSSNCAILTHGSSHALTTTGATAPIDRSTTVLAVLHDLYVSLTHIVFINRLTLFSHVYDGRGPRFCATSRVDYPSIGPYRESEQAENARAKPNDIHLRTDNTVGAQEILRHIFAAATFASMLASGVSGCSKDETLAPGFYRHSDNPTVFKVSAEGSPCVVADMAQLTALGGLQSLHVVEPSLAIAPEGKAPVACRWPTGYYRVGNTGEIYQVTDPKACVARHLVAGTKPFAISSRADLTGIAIGKNCPP